MIELLRCREPVGLGLLVNDLRCRTAARVLYRWLLAWLIITGRATVAGLLATGLAVTGCATAWAAALGWRGASGCAAASTWCVLTAACASARCCSRALSRCWSTWAAAAALVVFVLIRADVISAVTKVVYVVVAELVRGAVGV